MFQKAIVEVSKYTYPVIVSKRLISGQVKSGCATFFIINEDGWVITAAHVLADHQQFHEKHRKEVAEHEKQIAQIKDDSNINVKWKKKRIAAVPLNFCKKDIANFAL